MGLALSPTRKGYRKMRITLDTLQGGSGCPISGQFRQGSYFAALYVPSKEGNGRGRGGKIVAHQGSSACTDKEERCRGEDDAGNHTPTGGCVGATKGEMLGPEDQAKEMERGKNNARGNLDSLRAENNKNM